MGKAKVPSRGDKVRLELGLVTFGVVFYNAVDDSVGSVKRSQRTPEGHEVGNMPYDKETGEPVSRDDIHKVFVTDDGVEVDLSDDEIAAAKGFDSEVPLAETVGVYDMSELTKYMVAGTLQVRPDAVRNGSGKKKSYPYDKPFRLISDALIDADSFVLVRYVVRGGQRLVAVFGDGTAYLLHPANVVREELPLPEADYSEAELKQATMLIETLREPTVPVLEDDLTVAVREYAENKAQGGEPVVREKTEKQTEAVDLLAALSASIEAAKGGK